MMDVVARDQMVMARTFTAVAANVDAFTFGFSEFRQQAASAMEVVAPDHEVPGIAVVQGKRVVRSFRHIAALDPHMMRVAMKDKAARATADVYAKQVEIARL